MDDEKGRKGERVWKNSNEFHRLWEPYRDYAYRGPKNSAEV